MTLVQRICISGLLTPPLLLVFFGIFIGSPLLPALGPELGLGLSLVSAFFSGHCIVLAASLWRQLSK